MRNYRVTYQICQTTAIKPNIWVVDTDTHELFMVTEVDGNKVKGSKFSEYCLVENVAPIEIGLKPINRYGKKPTKKKGLSFLDSEYNKWKKEETYCNAIFIPFNFKVYSEMVGKMGTELHSDSAYLLSTFKSLF